MKFKVSIVLNKQLVLFLGRSTDQDDGYYIEENEDTTPVGHEMDESDNNITVIDLDSDDDDLTASFDQADSTSDDIPGHSLSRPQQFAVNRLTQFLRMMNITAPPCSLPPDQLDPILAEFYQRVRKCGGQEFGSGSLKTIQQFLENYFRGNNYPASITQSSKFQRSRNVLNAKVRQLRRHEESSLTMRRVDVDRLYACGQLGDSCPESIINTLWLMNTIRLNIKGCKRHTNLKWGDIGLQKSSQGTEMLVYHGTNWYVLGDSKEPSRCFINLYKKYWSMRPHNALSDDSPFYLCTRQHGFSSIRYGNKIGCVLKRMLLIAGLPQDKKISSVDIL